MQTSHTPRVAVIGNMNNAGFAIMRYFRDLGVDAKVFPFSTDGTGNLAHFAPEADTWEIERWTPFITPLPLPNTSRAVLAATPSGCHPNQKLAATMLANTNYLVGSGIAPAIMHSLGRRLDAFFPYGAGIEFYADHALLARRQKSPLHSWMIDLVRNKQAAGIRETRHCFNAELSITSQAFNEIGKPFSRLGIPAVYNRGTQPRVPPAGYLSQALARISMADLSLFTAARQVWERDPGILPQHWSRFTKNSDWLIKGVAEFIHSNPSADVILTCAEYGRDVDATKRLTAELGIERNVQWLPLMPRREVMLCLAASDIGVGEFHQDSGLLWGGTGWEILAAGRPFLQTFNFTPEHYRAEFGHNPPPIFDVKSPGDVTRHLQAILALPDRGRSVGKEAALWFDEHGGIGLAQKWLNLVLDRPDTKL